MLARLTAALLLLVSNAVYADEITGAGSSAAQPLYTKLADASVKHGATKLNYQPVGSAAGIRQIKHTASISAPATSPSPRRNSARTSWSASPPRFPAWCRW